MAFPNEAVKVSGGKCIVNGLATGRVTA